MRRLEHQILPLQRKRLALRQREESYMLIDVFELAEVKLTLLEQLHELLDATERYWLDQASLSHQRGLLLREADALVWQQFLPGGPTGSQVEEEDMTTTERMEWTTQVTICLGQAVRWVMMDTAWITRIME